MKIMHPTMSMIRLVRCETAALGQLGDGSTLGARRPQRVLGLPADPAGP
ncbi:MAG: hypothetical protein AAF447_19260 [Myxococcota bacterium]